MIPTSHLKCKNRENISFFVHLFKKVSSRSATHQGHSSFQWMSKMSSYSQVNNVVECCEETRLKILCTFRQPLRGLLFFEAVWAKVVVRVW